MQNMLNPISKQLHMVTNVLKRKKLLFGTAAIVVIGLVGFYFLGGAGKTAANYITDTVKKGTVTSTISASGMVEPVSTVSLSFKNSEVIKKIYVKVGDHVTAGQLLAEQDSDNLQAQLSQASASLKGAEAKLELLKNGAREEEVAQAEANVRMARAGYDLAKSNLERYQKLFQEGAIPQADLDKANNDYVNAEGKLKQAEESLRALRSGNRAEDIAAAAAQVESSSAQVKMAENDLAGSRMVSPIDGIVSAINGAEGQRATANNNNTSGGGFIVVISEALQVKAQVNEADIGRVEVGQRVEFTVNSFPNKTFTGRVSSISPQAYTVSNVQIYDAIVQLDENQQGLMAGMPANVNIIVDRHENTLTIPKGAVTYAVSYLNKTGQSGAMKPESSAGGGGNSGRPGRSGGDTNSGPGSGAEISGSAKGNDQKQQAAVLVLDKSGNPVPRRVVLGLSDLKSYEVLEGLNEGDTVVVGALNQGAASGTTNVRSQGNNSPLMPGIGGGGMRAGGGGSR